MVTMERLKTKAAWMPNRKTGIVGITCLALIALSSGCAYFQSKPTSSPYSYQSGQSPTEQSTSSSSVQPAAYYEDDGPEGSWFELSDLDPFNAPKTIKKVVNGSPSRQKAITLYEQADGTFRQAIEARNRGENAKSMFLQAADTFDKAALRWPNSALEQDAQFMAGESLFFADNYTRANRRFEQLIKTYPNTRHLDTVGVRRFAIAKYWMDAHRVRPDGLFSYNFFDAKRPKRDADGEAIRIFDKLRLDDPTGRLADDATVAAGTAYFEKGKFIDSSEFFEDLIRTFPSSEFQFTAHLLALKSKLESYQGKAYDAGPLDSAEELLKRIRKQFPQEANDPKNREYLQRAYAEIRYRKAERELNYAKYYDRRGEYRAARFYYNTLAQDYSDTPFGQQANERLARIQAKPSTPPQRFGWLLALFPVDEDVKPLFQGDAPTFFR